MSLGRPGGLVTKRGGLEPEVRGGVSPGELVTLEWKCYQIESAEVSLGRGLPLSFHCPVCVSAVAFQRLEPGVGIVPAGVGGGRSS